MLVAQDIVPLSICSSAMQSMDPEIVSLIASTDKASTGVVATVDKILANLEHAGLAYRLSVPPKLMGVHPCNRNGYGVSAIEMQALGVDICSMGFSWDACNHGVAVEASHENGIGDFTEKLTQGNPLFAT